MNELESLGWHWGRDGYVTVTAMVGGRAYAVKVPVADVRIEFGKVLPLGRGVGYVPTGVGLFGFIKKAIKKVGGAAKKAVSKAARGVTRRAGKIVRGAARVAGRGIRAVERSPLGYVVNPVAKVASKAYMMARSNPLGRMAIGATPLRYLEPAAQAYSSLRRGRVPFSAAKKLAGPIGATPLRALEPAAHAFGRARRGRLVPKRLLRRAARNTAIAQAFGRARRGRLVPKRLLRRAARNTAIARARKLRSYQRRRRMW